VFSSTGAGVAAGLVVAAVLVAGLPSPGADRLHRLRCRAESGRSAAAGRRGLWFIAALIAWLVAGVAGLVLAIGVVAVQRSRQERARRREEAAMRSALVDFWSTLAGEFAAGQPTAHAWPAAVAVADPAVAVAMGPVAAAAALGLPVAEPLLGVDAPGAESTRWVAAVTAVGAERGGAQAEALHRIAAAARAEQQQRARQEALLAGGRATTRVLLGLPVFGLLLGTAFGAEPLDFLLGSAIGRGCLAGAVGLLLVGRWWAERVVAQPAGSGPARERPIPPIPPDRRFVRERR
jgi:tight adherence protein B